MSSESDNNVSNDMPITGNLCNFQHATNDLPPPYVEVDYLARFHLLPSTEEQRLLSGSIYGFSENNGVPSLPPYYSSESDPAEQTTIRQQNPEVEMRRQGLVLVDNEQPMAISAADSFNSSHMVLSCYVLLFCGFLLGLVAIYLAL